ncbi:MAG: hypothetical protein ACYTGQ_06985, partial [Planctomycetota bacterium]
MDPYRSTESDVYSTEASVPAMLEFSDQTAEALARDLTGLPGIQGRVERAVLLVGDINNKTNTNTNDFEMMLIRTRNKIVGLPHIVQHFRVVEDLSRMRGAATRETGGSGGVASYEPEDVYVL